MGVEKQHADVKQAKKSKKGSKRAGATSYTGIALDPLAALTYSERLAYGLEEEVPDGPDHITADDMGRHGGFVLRARQIIKAHKQYLEVLPNFVMRFQTAINELDPKTGDKALQTIVEQYRDTLLGADEAGMFA